MVLCRRRRIFKGKLAGIGFVVLTIVVFTQYQDSNGCTNRDVYKQETAKTPPSMCG
uniref:Uncharacterized protein n=1 Tax=Magallana gigas TaxID=29159 RepID=K1P2W7_MAGGI